MLAIGAALVGLVSACSSSHHAASPPSTTSSTTAGPNPDVVPAVITPAYVNAVFGVLNHVNGNAVRALLAAHAVTAEVAVDLRAVYNAPLFAQELTIARQSLSVPVSDVKEPPGDRLTTVEELIQASSTCIFAKTTTSLSAVLVNPPAPAASEYFVLRPKQPGNDPNGLNPTPWAISFNATYLTATKVPNQCG